MPIGKPEQSVSVHLRIPSKVLDEIDAAAARAHITRTELVLQAVCDLIGLEWMGKQIAKRKS